MAKRKSAKERRRALFSDLKKGDIAPIYLIHGPDPYMLDHALEAITAAVCPNGVNEFNYHPIRGRDTTGSVIRESVELLPFLCERRLVVVRDLQAMAKKELEELRDYFVNPSPTTCLVFSAMTQTQQLDGRSGVIKSLKKHSAVYEFTAYYDNELDDFADRAAAKLGLRLDSNSRDYLVEAIGSDLSSLVGAIEKVDLYLGPDEGVRFASLQDVKAVVAETQLRSVFTLTNSLGEKDFYRSIKLLGQMMWAGEPALRILTMVTRHFRIVSMLQEPSLEGQPRAVRAKAVGVSPYFLKDYESDARRFSARELVQIRDQLLHTDIALKSSRTSNQILMERLVLQICQRRTATRR